ncbi:MAG: alpha/beta hydrolase family protein [Nitrospinota bacterium]
MVDEAVMLKQTVREWFPRFLANGVDYNDAVAITGRVRDWSQWCEEWSRESRRYEELGEKTLAQGNTLTAAEAFVRASLYFHYGQLVFFRDPEQRRRAHERRVAAYTKALPHLRPSGERVEIPFEEFRLPAILRIPRGGRPAPCVLLVPGMDSAKEEYHSFSERLLARGMATLAFDGPGQGETWYFLKLRADYEKATSAALDYLCTRPEIDPERIGIFGRSFGGYLAPRAAGCDSRFRACVGVGGFYDLSFWETSMIELIKEDFQNLCGAKSEEEAQVFSRRITLDGVAKNIRCPLLIVHGRRDVISAPDQAERIVAAAPEPKELWMYEEGNHVCENLATVYRPLVADWLAGHLSAEGLAQ